MQRRIGQAFFDLPWQYDKGEEVSVLFQTDRDVLQSLLPPVLELPDGPGLATLSAVHHERSSFGPYVGVYLGMLAQYKGETVLHRLTGMKSTFSGAAGGRELWAIPYQVGEPTMEWDGDVLNIVARRNGLDFARLSMRLERRVEKPPSRTKNITSVARRPPWENAEKESVLLGSRIEAANPAQMVFWTGSAVLKLIGGDPGDDWSILPVQEVIEANYSVGGQSALLGGYILEEY